MTSIANTAWRELLRQNTVMMARALDHLRVKCRSFVCDEPRLVGSGPVRPQRPTTSGFERTSVFQQSCRSPVESTHTAIDVCDSDDLRMVRGRGIGMTLHQAKYAGRSL